MKKTAARWGAQYGFIEEPKRSPSELLNWYREKFNYDVNKMSCIVAIADQETMVN